MRVDVLVTGRTEAVGIAPALRRLFPDHEFQVVLERPLDGTPFPSFTSSLLPVPRSSAPSAADKLAQAAIAHLVPGRRGDPPDLLVVLDDVELHHVGCAQIVVDTFAGAVRGHLERLEHQDGRLAARCRAAARERLSLHLVQPMIEAWFFPDPGALAASGAQSPPVVDPTGDPEAFLTTDSAFLQATDTDCARWVARGRLKKDRPKWMGDQRDRHPKGYLQWLCRDAEHKACTRYHETEGGGTALAGLDWNTLAGRPDGQMQFFRSLVADLADALGQPPSTGRVSGMEAAETSRFRSRRTSVLRNG